jgi:hypothetical protein
MILALLKWEAAYATLPADILGQVSALSQLFGTGWFPIVAMLLLGIALFVVGLGPDRLEAWAGWLSRHRTNGTRPDREREAETQRPVAPVSEDLRQRCCELASEIRKFYNRQQEDLDKRLQSSYAAVFLEEPHRTHWRAEQTERHEKWMVDRYSELFGGAVSDLCDNLEPHEWCSPEERKRFENPTGAQDIRYTAQRLEVICCSR